MRDINLIPRSRYNFLDYVKSTITIGLIISLFVFVIFFGIIDPLQRKRIAERTYDLHTIQIENFKGVDVENTEFTARLDELRLRKEALSELFAEKLPKSVLMEGIDIALPDRVHIDNIVYGDGTITLQGNALSPIEIADLSIGLTKTGLFASMRIINIERAIEREQHSFLILGRLVEDY